GRFIRSTQRVKVSAYIGKVRSRKAGTQLYGMASFYWQPQPVASGGRFNPNALTAAHKTLPFGTRVRVTNLNNNRSVVVVINDRGPYIRGRIIDLSRRAAGVVGMRGSGIAPVRVTVLGRTKLRRRKS
ncbi:MAG: septal ring lytic transglycosylase RlpA family protein, partial [Pseudomonadota bacterium]